MSNSLDALRAELNELNYEILDLLSRRAEVASAVRAHKVQHGMPIHDPAREQRMLTDLVERNPGPFSDETISHLFGQILRASVDMMRRQAERVLKVSRAYRSADLVVTAGGHTLGGSEPAIIAGPCAVETEEQMEQVAAELAQRGVGFLRGGCFKPRSSPYAFQGLGVEGLRILSAAARRHGLATVTEVMDARDVPAVVEHADILQVGARNMHNYTLLRELGRVQKPILLKRGLAATLDEFLWAAEYVVLEGNEQVILCERGIRTYERETRNTLDISAVPLLRQKSFLPVVVDVSHAAGRKDILAPLGRAALAAGANGVMVEVHPFPAGARSDAQQQFDFDEFGRFLEELGMGAGTVLRDIQKDMRRSA